MSPASNLPQNRRAPMRLDGEDGPWSVSVAESPHDSRSYSLYIRTPTHNLTLTRTALEIVELDTQLRDTYPSVKVPPLPLDADVVKSMPTKRKSTFLNTLSRLASPHSAKTRRLHSGTSNTTPSNTASPIVSPSAEQNDPFQSFTPSAITSTLPETVKSTSLAAYLTTVSNTFTLRQARVWKRFVRVRTDDLESVRVERAIKRVRSDLAAHTAMSGIEKTNGAPEAPDVVDEKQDQDLPPIPLDGDDAQDVLAEDDTQDTSTDVATESAPVAPAEEEPATPIQDAAPSRIVRSRSVDLEKSSRLSRSFTSSSIVTDGTSSQTDRETGDESSTSHLKKPKKKRSMSVDPKKKSRKVVIDDFEMMRVLGKGCAGKVLLVKHKSTSELYALKAITKRHVLAHQELQHTLTEQAVLKTMSAEAKDPFVVKLWWSFHDKENLFLVMDFHPGGDLATQLARWGRLGRDRARFYAAEIVEGVEGLHAAGVIYRDLKPENILIGADGHIVLTDFGLSKEFPRQRSLTASDGEICATTPSSPPWMKVEKGGEIASGWPGQPAGHSDMTATFCGTAEYLAPEVIQAQEYSYQVDWWSFGTMLYEMLTGMTPFWAANHPDMYIRVLQDELHFPDDRVMDQDTKSLLRGLLQRNPLLRISEPRIKRHPYFSMIDWSHVYYKRYIPPYIPPIDPSNASDTQNFDETFLDMEPVLDEFDENEQSDTDQDNNETDTDRTDGDSNTTPSQSRSSSVVPREAKATPAEDDVDAFDGYSFKGRQSILIDDEDEESSEEETDEEEEEALALKGLELDLSSIDTDAPLVSEETDLEEPKTPEARPTSLMADDTLPPLPDSPPSPSLSGLPVETNDEAVVETTTLPAVETPHPPSVESNTAIPTEASAAPVSEHPTISPTETKPRKAKVHEQVATKAIPDEKASSTKAVHRPSRPPRREKSGVPALDKYLSDVGDEGTITEHDDEDDDWDFVEAADGEDRNGTKGTSLFARGVVDRYRLAVFRKASTPNNRSVSGTSTRHPSEVDESPSPTQHRGRSQLTFRKNPRQFLKPKTPPSSYSSKTSMTPSMKQSRSSKFSSSSSAGGLDASSTGVLDEEPPSLRSKPSALSVGGLSEQSDMADAHDILSASEATQSPKDRRTKKLRKYKENAEKVLSLFSPSPRPPQPS